MSTFADMEGDETFDSSLLGHADEVVEERVADDDVIMIKGTKTNSAVRNYSLNYYLYDWDISLSKYIYQKKKKSVNTCWSNLSYLFLLF